MGQRTGFRILLLEGRGRSGQKVVPGKHLSSLQGKEQIFHCPSFMGRKYKMPRATTGWVGILTAPERLQLSRRAWCFSPFGSLWIQGRQALSLGPFIGPRNQCRLCRSEMTGRSGRSHNCSQHLKGAFHPLLLQRAGGVSVSTHCP